MRITSVSGLCSLMRRSNEMPSSSGAEVEQHEIDFGRELRHRLCPGAA